jgi:hypothetical protein
MHVVLHEGHQHSESASSAVGLEMMVLITVGLLALGGVAAYAALWYTRG